MCPDALSASASPEVVWAALAPQIAGQQKVRVWDPATGRFGSKRRLSSRMPSAPAAVRIYDRHRRAAVLVLDFDAKGVNTPVEVDRQVDAVVALLGECGARVVTDRSRSGGRHVYVPLATPLGVQHFGPALRLLRDRFPALDISPMSNDREGHITVPGSACKEGGHRELVDIGLDDAVAAFTERSQPGLIARLVATLGGVSDLTAGQRVIDDVTALGRITGTGSEVRLNDQFRLTSPIPGYVTEWATSAGALPGDGRWRSTSEARQAVIGHAVLRGATLAEVTARVTDGTWPAVLASYTQRRDPPAPRIRRDFFAALRWAARIAHEFRSPGHKTGHTGAAGREIFLRDIPRQTWLANATKWVEETFPGTAHRWTVLAVLQGLAYASGVAGELINDTPVVAVGGRSLSLAAGLLPETTVWEVLAEIRDIPGAPIHRIRIGAGQLADCYTLVQARDERGRPIEETAQRRRAGPSRTGPRRLERARPRRRPPHLRTRRIHRADSRRGRLRRRRRREIGRLRHPGPSGPGRADRAPAGPPGPRNGHPGRRRRPPPPRPSACRPHRAAQGRARDLAHLARATLRAPTHRPRPQPPTPRPHTTRGPTPTPTPTSPRSSPPAHPPTAATTRRRPAISLPNPPPSSCLPPNSVPPFSPRPLPKPGLRRGRTTQKPPRPVPRSQAELSISPLRSVEEDRPFTGRCAPLGSVSRRCGSACFCGCFARASTHARAHAYGYTRARANSRYCRGLTTCPVNELEGSALVATHSPRGARSALTAIGARTGPVAYSVTTRGGMRSRPGLRSRSSRRITGSPPFAAGPHPKRGSRARNGPVRLVRKRFVRLPSARSCSGQMSRIIQSSSNRTPVEFADMRRI